MKPILGRGNTLLEMAARRRTLFTLLSLSLLAPSACAQHGESSSQLPIQRELTQDEAQDPNTLRDEDYAFELRRPGSGWELHGPEGARQLNSIGRAVMMMDNGATVIVLVERSPYASAENTLAAYEPLMRPGETPERLDFQGYPALRVRFAQEIQGGRTSTMHTLFVRDGFVFQVISGHPGDEDFAQALALQSAFVPLEGPIRGPALARDRIESASGVTWRIREGRYESATTGWRYLPPPELDANFIVGEELAKLGGFDMVAATPGGIHVTLTSEAIEAREAEAERAAARASFDARAGAVVGELELELGGERRTFALREAKGHVYATVDLVEGARLNTFTLWYPAHDADTLAASLGPLLAGFERIPAGARETLRAELLAAAADQRCPGPARSVVGSELALFDAGVGWAAPDGFWDLCGYTQHEGGDTVMAVFEDELEIHAELRFLPAERQEQLEPGKARALEHVLGRGALVERGTWEHDALRYEWILVEDTESFALEYHAFAVDAREDRLVYWMQAAEQDSPLARERMKAAITGLRVGEELPRVRVADARTIDRRYGVSLIAPAGFTHHAAIEGAPLQWSLGDASVHLSAVRMPERADADWARRWISGRIGDYVERRQLIGTVRVEPLELAGLPAEALSWASGQAADLVIHRGWLYAVGYSGLDAEQIAAVRSSFELL